MSRGVNEWYQLRDALYQLANSGNPADQALAAQVMAEFGGRGDVGMGPGEMAPSLPDAFGPTSQPGMQPAGFGVTTAPTFSEQTEAPGVGQPSFSSPSPANQDQANNANNGSVGMGMGRGGMPSAPNPPSLADLPGRIGMNPWSGTVQVFSSPPTPSPGTFGFYSDPMNTMGLSIDTKTPAEHNQPGGMPGASRGGDEGGVGDGPGGPGSGLGGVGPNGDNAPDGSSGRRKGGPIPKTGKYDLHAGEHVMNPEATKLIGPARLQEINKAAMGQAANKKGLTGPNSQDTELAHITPREKKMLAKKSGGVKKNPISGLMAFYDSDGGNTDGSPAGDGPGGDVGGAAPGADANGAGAGEGPGGAPGMGSEGPGPGMGAAPSDNAGGAYGGGGIGSTEAFGGGGSDQNGLFYGNPQPPPIIFTPPAQAPQTSTAITTDLDQMIKDLETYQPIGYQGNWLTYAMPSGTYGGAQHRFQRRTNDPVASNANVYAADTTYDSAAWPNVPGVSGGIASLPGTWTGSPAMSGPGPYNQLKSKAGYGILGLM